MHRLIALFCALPSLLVAAEGNFYLKKFTAMEKAPQKKESPLSLSENELEMVAEQIWYNECGGRVEGLVCWNEGESFVSLGIGHFIWFCEGESSPFSETFPELVTFLEKEGANLPKWLHGRAPWRSREEFYRDSKRRSQLRDLLYETRSLQARFMVERLEKALPQMIVSLSPEEQLHVVARFERVKSEPLGNYALIDYLNFKGEGSSSAERYEGEGWGLLQVLQRMNPGTGLDEFARCAKEILRGRVRNAPPERQEDRWLAGWESRVDTYTKSNR